MGFLEFPAESQAVEHRINLYYLNQFSAEVSIGADIDPAYI
jgi:hypothetical protein